MVANKKWIALFLVFFLFIALNNYSQTSNTKSVVKKKSREYKNMFEQTVFGNLQSTALSVIKTTLPFVVIITGAMALLTYTKKTFEAENRTTQQKQKNIYFAAFLFLIAIIIAAYISGQL